MQTTATDIGQLTFFFLILNTNKGYEVHAPTRRWCLFRKAKLDIIGVKIDVTVKIMSVNQNITT
jgi:hypothetical protein